MVLSDHAQHMLSLEDTQLAEWHLNKFHLFDAQYQVTGDPWAEEEADLQLDNYLYHLPTQGFA
ncbi:MAG: hypothetical protein ACREEW_14415 [Caulobacteraceae bacterium]